MDESTRLFLSARINMFKLLTRDGDDRRELLSAEDYQAFKDSLKSFNMGQGSYAYHVPVSRLEEMKLDVAAWREVAQPLGGAKDTLGLTDYYHVCEMDNVLDHLINNQTKAIDALQQAVAVLDGKQEMKRA